MVCSTFQKATTTDQTLTAWELFTLEQKLEALTKSSNYALNQLAITANYITNNNRSYQAAGQGWYVSSPSLLQLLPGSHSSPSCLPTICHAR